MRDDSEQQVIQKPIAPEIVHLEGYSQKDPSQAVQIVLQAQS